MSARVAILVAGTLTLCSSADAGLTAWINEIHYDNGGPDTGEFVEVVLPAGADPEDYTLTMYNGNNTLPYNTFHVGHMIEGDTVDGFTFYWWDASSIQNGAPDGMALSDTGGLIEFLSYEGTFVAGAGAANGVLSTDIGVSESGATTVGSSLGLTGSFPSFTWTTFTAPLSGGAGGATPGSLNFGQVIPAPGAIALLGFAGLAGCSRRRRTH